MAEELKDSEIQDINSIDGDAKAGKDAGNSSKSEDNKKLKKYTRMNRKGNKFIWIILGVIIVAVIVRFVVFKKNNKMTDMTNDDVETATVTDKEIFEVSTATGTLYSGDARNVTTMLNEASKIQNLYISVGDYVSAGDVLVEFSTEEINKDISEKQEDISLQKKEDAIAAKDSQREYFKSYDDAASSLTDASEETNKALKDLYEACDDYGKAKEKYKEIEKERDEKLDDAHGENERKSIEETYKSKLESQQNVIDSKFVAKEKAETNYSDTVKKQAKNVSNQQDSLSKADSTYERNNVTAKKNVTSLQRQLEDLQDKLDQYVVKSPIDGVVTSVGVSEGNSFKEGTVATIQNDSVYTVTVKIDEYDINKVKQAYKKYCENQENGRTQYDIGTAKITTNATNDQNITYFGHITEIAPTSVATTNYSTQATDSSNSSASQSTSSSSSSANYEVKLVVDGLDDSYIENDDIENKLSEEDAMDLLMIGMTAKVSIVVDESEKDTLTVPYNAVTKVKEDNDNPYRYFVEVVTTKEAADMTNQNDSGIEVEKPDSNRNGMGASGKPNMRGRSRNRGLFGSIKGLFSKEDVDDTVSPTRFTKKVEVLLIFENDYYCSIKPKIDGQIKVGDEVILTDEDTSGNDMNFMMGPGMGGF